MLDFDPTRTLTNVRAATTEDLLDRVTAYRAGLEPEAIELIEGELRRRDVDADEIAARQEECTRACLFGPDGSALACDFCHRPAVAGGRRWFRLWGVLPLFPLPARFCREHRPAQPRD